MLDIVSSIDFKKGEINQLLMLQDKPPMFDEGFEGNRRRKILSTKCCSEADLGSFASELYKIVYEETQTISNAEIKSKGKLGKFRNDPFTIYVAVLRHHFQHSADALFQRKITIQDVYKKYLGKVTVPKTPEEFQAIQLGMLKDFLAFLETIYAAISESDFKMPETNNKKIISGTIKKDKDGLIYCKNVLLSKTFYPYIGCKCEIESKILNTDVNSQGTYPFFTKFLSAIYVNITGCVNKDTEVISYKDISYQSERITEFLQVRSILIPYPTVKEGQIVQITKIESNTDEDSRYRFIVSQYRVLKSKVKKSAPIPELTIELGKEYPVDLDTHGNTFVGNVLIGKKKDCHKGDIVKITKVQCPQNGPKVPSDYPYTAKELIKVKVDTGTAKIYTVEKDKDGVLHAENFMFPLTTKVNVGDRVMIFQFKKNKDKEKNSLYPLVVGKFVILNPNDPKAEEKATKVVGKFSKFIETNKQGLKWIGGAIAAVVIVVLSQANIIKD